MTDWLWHNLSWNFTGPDDPRDEPEQTPEEAAGYSGWSRIRPYEGETPSQEYMQVVQGLQPGQKFFGKDREGFYSVQGIVQKNDPQFQAITYTGPESSGTPGHYLQFGLVPDAPTLSDLYQDQGSLGDEGHRERLDQASRRHGLEVETYAQFANRLATGDIILDDGKEQVNVPDAPPAEWGTGGFQ